MIRRSAADPVDLIRTRFSSSAESTQGRSHRLGVVDVGDDIGMAEQEPAQPVDRMDQETDAHAGVTGVEVFTLDHLEFIGQPGSGGRQPEGDRKSTRLNSSHVAISYAVFCLEKKMSLFVSSRSLISMVHY